MQTKEIIEVFIDCRKGRTVCICKKEKKMCRKHCELTTVERDKFKDLELVRRQNKYGRCDGID